MDDDEEMRATLRDLLERYDCTFEEAEDGVAALAALATRAFDVICLDFALPDMSGIDILRQARKLYPKLGSVIILSALYEAAIHADASELDAEYLQKTDLAHEIRGAFERAFSRVPETSIAPHPNRRVRRRSSTAARQKRERASVPRLLVLDDDPIFLKSIKDFLGDEFDLRLTTSAAQACKWARHEVFALVILDMWLQDGATGLEVLARMRKNRSDLRAIILTQRPDHHVAFESAKRGALDYVSKDEIETLPAKVAKSLRPDGAPVRVFLCYDRRDENLVLALFARLTESGFLPWMDKKSLVVGLNWERQILRAIDNCDYFVFCVSRFSVRKEGMLRLEVKHALRKQKGLMEDHVYFITARLDDVEIETPFSKFQHVDVFKREGLARLLEALSAPRTVSS